MFDCYICVFFFFFFKQKTAYEITTGDWSSDVCSSDLNVRSRSIRASRLHEAELVAVGVPDRELARSVLRVHQRLEDIGVVAQSLPPAVDVVDLKVESNAYRRRRLVPADRELGRAEGEVGVRRCLRRPVPFCRHAEERL